MFKKNFDELYPLIFIKFGFDKATNLDKKVIFDKKWLCFENSKNTNLIQWQIKFHIRMVQILFNVLFFVCKEFITRDKDCKFFVLRCFFLRHHTFFNVTLK